MLCGSRTVHCPPDSDLEQREQERRQRRIKYNGPGKYKMRRAGEREARRETACKLVWVHTLVFVTEFPTVRCFLIAEYPFTFPSSSASYTYFYTHLFIISLS